MNRISLAQSCRASRSRPFRQLAVLLPRQRGTLQADCRIPRAVEGLVLARLLLLERPLVAMEQLYRPPIYPTFFRLLPPAFLFIAIFSQHSLASDPLSVPSGISEP